jgi:hypothetical protein
MLWAQFQPKNDAEAAGFFVGVMIAGVISGAIPFITGLCMKQSGLAVIGGVISAGAGALAGCCLGIPVALVFTIIIIVMAQYAGPAHPRVPYPEEDDYDYARHFQPLPRHGDQPDRRPSRGEPDRRDPDRREADRRREADDDWRRRAEDEDRYRDRGFRPRRRGDDADI